MNLYELNEQMELLDAQLIDSETGEINEEVMEQLEKLEMDHKQKLENIGILIKTLTFEADGLTAEKKRLDKRIKQKMAKIERLCNYVNNDLKGEAFETSKVHYHYRKSQSVDVIDEDAIPEQYMDYQTVKKPIKTDIKKALKAGEEVPGCQLRTNFNLQVE